MKLTTNPLPILPDTMNIRIKVGARELNRLIAKWQELDQTCRDRDFEIGTVDFIAHCASRPDDDGITRAFVIRVDIHRQKENPINPLDSIIEELERLIEERSAEVGAGSMPTIISGDPGEVWVNSTDKILWQFQCRFQDSCGLCVQFANLVGKYWPIPMHHGCNCRNIPIRPGASAQPFVDYQKAVAELDPRQQARVMGASNWKLVESGRVTWSDVVTKARVKDFHQVVAEQKLTVKDMTGVGISSYEAKKALGLITTPAHVAAQAARKVLVDQLRGEGLSDAEIKLRLVEILKQRIQVQRGPEPPTRPTFRPTPTGPQPLPRPGQPIRHPDEPRARFVASDRSRREGEKLVWVDVASLDRAWSEDPGFYVGPGGTGENAQPGKYAEVVRLIESALERGIPIDLPEVHLAEDGSIRFTDGRHRFAVFRDRGLKRLPMAVSADSAKALAARHGVRSAPTSILAESIP